jgi:uncharacterized protein YdeI (YjbR/CyaY-like superfamily)
VTVPVDLQRALDAKQLSEPLSSMHRRERVRWGEEAKREQTRRIRVAGPVTWLPTRGADTDLVTVRD